MTLETSLAEEAGMAADRIEATAAYMRKLVDPGAIPFCVSVF